MNDGRSWFLDVCNLVRVFADFWKVFDIAVCWITYEIVANWPDFVCLLFVREYNRLKPVKYDRIVLTLDRLPANTSFATNQNGVHFHARHKHLHRCFAPSLGLPLAISRLEGIPSCLRFVAEDSGNCVAVRFCDQSRKPSDWSVGSRPGKVLPAFGDQSLWPVTEAEEPDPYRPTLETALL